MVKVYTVEEIERDVPSDKNLTRAQLIDYLLDEMNSFNLERHKIAIEKLKVLCPNRSQKQ